MSIVRAPLYISLRTERNVSVRAKAINMVLLRSKDPRYEATVSFNEYRTKQSHLLDGRRQ